VIYTDGIMLVKLYTKQIKCIILKFKGMKSICTLVFFLAISISLAAQISYDTSYTRQWNSETSEWENFDRIISSFDNGLITSEMIQIKKDEQWINYNFKAYYYDNGRVIEEFEQYWNESKLKWEDNYRKLYSYDGEGKLMQITHQNIFKGKYINTSKEILIYTSDGKLKEKIIQKFVNRELNTEKAWSNFLKYQYYYNSNDLLINENLAEWKSDSWENDSFNFNYVYDLYGNLIEKIKAKKAGSKERNISKETFVLNAAQQLVEHFICEWDPRKKSWLDNTRAVYENNANGKIVSMIVQQKNENTWDNYFYAEYSGNYSAQNEMNINDLMTFSVYPSDYGDNAMVRFSNPYNELYCVSIMNADGLIIGSATTDKDQISIDALNLDRGLYYLELQGSNLFSGKFSIE
jgi:hypothetical protein